MAGRDPASNQLNDFKNSQKQPEQVTASFGQPLGDRYNSLTIGERGPVLLQDIALIDELAHFQRERIPERVVHAKGAGAFGYFEVTHDITKYCKAKVFEQIGKKTPIAVRFSTVGGESGSADSARDPRGFAVKFYTEDGNWGLIGNNTPIFFIRDPLLFPSFIHTQKRNPKTHLKDPDMFWDFMTLRPETYHQLTFHFTDRGTPDGYRHMNGYGSHTFKLVNAKNEAIYCKFHFKTDQGIKNLDAKTAEELASSDPDFAIRDLYNSIDNGNYPSWTLHIQIMTFKQAENWEFNPFDLTKVWPQKDYPLIPVGRIVLNRNPNNYFAEVSKIYIGSELFILNDGHKQSSKVEQAAYSPSELVPGIEPSPDKMLQGRLFAYDDTHRHRIGANYLMVPVNCPYRTKIRNYQRDGPMNVTDNQGGAPNYFPNSFHGPTDEKSYLECPMKVKGSGFSTTPDVDITRFDSSYDDNYTQPGNFYRKVLKEHERDTLANNIANHLVLTQEFIQEKALVHFSKCDPDYGARVKKALERVKGERMQKRNKL